MALMNRMRENTKVILMILVVAFMLTIIIDWGMGGFKTGQKPGVIATVNGDDIMYDEYKQMYDNQMASYRQERGSDPTGFQLSQMENQIFESLVQQRLMQDELHAIGLKATNAEITEEIWNNPPEMLRTHEAFKDSLGNFDEARYQAILNSTDPQVNLFWADVENYMRMILPMEKLNLLLDAGFQVTDDDARIEYMKQNAQAKIKYVFFNSSDYAVTTPPTDAEIENYYNAHKDDYKEIEKRVLDYVLFETKPTAADTEAIFEQARDLVEELNDGGDFAQLARLYSQDDGTAQNGGDLGYFNRTAMVKPFADAAFSTPVGKIVGPVESRFGLHIIKVEDKRRQDGEEQVKASHILLKFEISASTRNAISEEADYIASNAKEMGFDELAKSDSLKVDSTTAFEKGGFIPGIGMENRINNFAYRSKVGDVSQVFSVDKGYIVAKLAKIIPEHVKSLDEVKDQILTALENDAKMALAMQAAQKVYQEVKSGASLETLQSRDSLKVEETDYFKMNGFISKIGREPEITGTAFKLNTGEFSEPVKGSRGYYVVQLVDKKEINEQEFEKQKEQIKLQLASRYKQQIYEKWYTSIKDDAKIKDYRQMYF